MTLMISILCPNRYNDCARQNLILGPYNFALMINKLTSNRPVEKMAFFDASDLYALNPQQEALNCIVFIFSDL